jgi:putative ABC transport system permease protein
LRVTMRNRLYSFINTFGLTLGMTGAALLFLWVGKEFSYDQFHESKERIYKAWNREIQHGEAQCWSNTPRILAPTLVQEYPAVESAISYASYGSPQLFTAGKTKLIKNSGVYTDPQFLTMFSFPLLKGDQSKALNDPNAIVLTESFARQLFGNREAFGETISIEESGYTFQFTVTGILKDLPSNTDFLFDYLISFQFLESIGERDTHWQNNSVGTYVKLREGEDADQFNTIVKDVAKKHSDKETSREIFIYPLSKMRLYSRFENGVPAGGRIEIVRMLGLLGICLIAMACVNFVNLSTARAQRRSKEVGIRKVTGAYRYSLIIQFLCESVLIALGAGIFSVVMVYLLLPWFSTLIHQPLALSFYDLSFWIKALAFVTFIGLLAGLYPAFYLSSFQPVRILKGARITAGNRNMLRQSLVVFQFGFAVTLIVSVIVVSKQIRYVQNREAGYAREHLIYQPATHGLQKNYAVYKNELLTSGTATSVTLTSAPITEQWSNTRHMKWNGKDPQNTPVVDRFIADEGISKTAGLTILEGRDMDLQRFPSDSSAALLNETAVKLMGFKQPIGEIITDDGAEWHVVGVVKDFVLTSPHSKITPLVVMGARKNMFSTIHIRLNPARATHENLNALSALFAKYDQAHPFEYHFVDEVYERKFDGMKTTLTITGIFSSLAIIIACLGLLGLSIHIIESRVKEIGIRKVLGGSVAGLTRLLCMHSIKPILLAILLFSPMAWLSMNWWLQTFDYRIAMDVWIILAAASVILAVALTTIIIQTFSAANTNPVKSLRSE